MVELSCYTLKWQEFDLEYNKDVKQLLPEKEFKNIDSEKSQSWNYMYCVFIQIGKIDNQFNLSLYVVFFYSFTSTIIIVITVYIIKFHSFIIVAGLMEESLIWISYLLFEKDLTPTSEIWYINLFLLKKIAKELMNNVHWAQKSRKRKH